MSYWRSELQRVLNWIKRFEFGDDPVTLGPGGISTTGPISGGNVTLTSSDAGAAAAPILRMERNSASPIPNDLLAGVQWFGMDSGGNATRYADMFATLVDPTDGSEDGSLTIRATVAGVATNRVTLNAAGVTLGGAFTATGGGSLTGTWSNLGTVTTVDINGGTIDGAAIGATTPSTVAGTTGTFTGKVTSSTAAAVTEVFEGICTDAGATGGPFNATFRDSASPATADVLGGLPFYGRNSAAEKTRYALIAGGIGSSVTDGTEVGRIFFQALVAGVGTNVVIIDGGVVSLERGQLKFPATQNPSSDANTLDAYEERTFTPTSVGTTAAGAGTYDFQAGVYTKIGNAVLFHASASWTAHTGTGNLRLEGLPFTAAGNNIAVSIFSNSLTYAGTLAARVLASSTQVEILSNATGAAPAAVAMDTSAAVTVSGLYFV